MRDSHAEPTAEYHVKWSWRSPLTLAILTWVSAALGVLSVVAGWQGFSPLFSAIGSGLPPEPTSPGWVIAFFVVVLMLMIVLALRGVAKHRTQHFSPLPWLPTLTGWGGRIGLARLQGKCPIDGGKLRFYDKPSKWIDYSNGRQKVTERRMVAECVKNGDHCWLVDKTDGGRD